MLFTIIAAIIIAAAVAFIIVKYLPLKLRPLVSIILLIMAGFLTWKIYDGVMKPIQFNQEKKVIYSNVIDQLRMIRDAEIAYKEVTGKYTKDMDGLIKFIDTAKLAITQTINVTETVNKGTKRQPIMVEVDKRVTDTIGFEPVIDRFKGRDYKNMFNVPNTDKKFTLEVGTVEKVPGLVVPVFQASVSKDIVLAGMDVSLIKIEKEALSSDEIRGAFISVGSLNEVSTGGNWPPSYDNKDEREKVKKD